MVSTSRPWRPAPGEVTKFNPRPYREKQAPLDRIPRYLFRVFDENSGGTTDLTYVSSPAADAGVARCTRDLFSQPRLDAALQLFRHLSQQHIGILKDVKDNLMSWTSSVLVAVQYALYRSATRPTKKGQGGVYIMMIDTRSFPVGTFIRDMEAIECLEGTRYPLKDFYRLRSGSAGYYFGEYLTQGCVNVEGQVKVTSLERLVDLGLFDLHPFFEPPSYWASWAKRVVQLRKEIWEQGQHPVKDHGETRARMAVTIAQGCFGGEWVFPFVVMLLSLSKRSHDAAEKIYCSFSGEEISEMALDKEQVDPRGLPEVFEYQGIIEAILRFEDDRQHRMEICLKKIGVGETLLDLLAAHQGKGWFF